MKKLLISIFLILAVTSILIAYKKMNEGDLAQVCEIIDKVCKFALEKIYEIPKLGKATPQICSAEDSWVTAPSHNQEGETHYFIGLSFDRQTAEEAEKKALEYTFARIRKYLSSNSDGNAAISIENYDIVNFCYDGAEMHYNAAVKIAVPDEEIKRIINDNRSKK